MSGSATTAPRGGTETYSVPFRVSMSRGAPSSSAYTAMENSGGTSTPARSLPVVTGGLTGPYR